MKTTWRRSAGRSSPRTTSSRRLTGYIRATASARASPKGVFVKQDYKKFLNELIELKLFKIEAENMGFDKEPDT